MKEIKTLQECKEQAAQELHETEFQFVHAAYANNDVGRANLLYRVTDLAANIYAEQFEPEWINLDDQQPKPNQHCLVCRVDGVVNVDVWMQFHGGQLSFIYKVTHWMPLPCPPKN